MCKTSTKILNNQTLAIGVKIKGKKKVGFKIKGAPNKIGSLTPKTTGIEAARPTAFNSLDFDQKANMKVITKVAPVPPKVATKYWVP